MNNGKVEEWGGVCLAFHTFPLYLAMVFLSGERIDDRFASKWAHVYVSTYEGIYTPRPVHVELMFDAGGKLCALGEKMYVWIDGWCVEDVLTVKHSMNEWGARECTYRLHVPIQLFAVKQHPVAYIERRKRLMGVGAAGAGAGAGAGAAVGFGSGPRSATHAYILTKVRDEIAQLEEKIAAKKHELLAAILMTSTTQ